MASPLFNNCLSSIFVAVTSLMSLAFSVAFDCCIASSTHDLKNITVMQPPSTLVRGRTADIVGAEIRRNHGFRGRSS